LQSDRVQPAPRNRGLFYCSSRFRWINVRNVSPIPNSRFFNCRRR
jgi:hypothetical protein